MTKSVRALIVDDSALARRVLEDVLSADPGIDVIGTASDPFAAAAKLRTCVPDVIVLDIEMPRMDGITFLRKLMRQHPIPTVICSTLAEAGSATAMEALEAGAVDLIQKPTLGTKAFFLESAMRIRDTVRAAAAARVSRLHRAPVIRAPQKHSADAVLARRPARAMTRTTDKVIAIGASTGGTEALREVLEAMPIDGPGVVVVQHMPEGFTATFARRLDELCRMQVREAAGGDSVLRGQALIAPGNRHLVLRRSGARYYVEVVDGELVNRHRPSVDVLLRSVAQTAGPNAVGVVMTGMGDDGARGLKEMRDAGATTIAQDEKTSVVYGMPAEAVKHGGAMHVLPLGRIAAEALRFCG
ncbi:MAG: protein-glutamate methylesterase/protein-glutamine glutaminase [Myxococcota bacterium]